MLFDKVGAARSVARTRPCLMGLPEGEGCAFTLTTLGVWLVQIPDVKMKIGVCGTSDEFDLYVNN
ncbi:MAG: hypothetical protein ABJL72_21590 [Roseobacter sp.]